MTAAMVALMPLISMGQKATIENPTWTKRSVHSASIAIEKVETTPKTTTLYFKCWHGYAEGTMRIAKDSYIMADGKKLMLKKADGVPLNSFFKSNAEGFTRTFALTFPAVNKTTQYIDFIESDCPTCFQFIGVPVTEAADKKNKEIRKQADDMVDRITSMADDGKPLEQNQLMLGTTTIKGKIIGYKKELFDGAEVSVKSYINNPLTRTQNTFATDLKSDGTFELVLPLTSKKESVLFRVNPLYSGLILVGIGETEEFIVDLDRLGDYRYVNPNKYMYFDGANAEFNNALVRYEEIDQIDHDKEEELMKSQDPEKFKNGIIALTNEQKAKIDATEMPERVRQYMKHNLDLDIVRALARAPMDFQMSYIREAMESGTSPNEIEYKSPDFSLDYFKQYSKIDVNDPQNLYNNNIGEINMYARYSLDSYVGSRRVLEFFKKAKEDGWMNPEYEKAIEILTNRETTENYPISEEDNTTIDSSLNGIRTDFARIITGKESGMLFDMMKCNDICEPLHEKKLIPESDIAELEKLGSPVYAQFARQENAKIMAEKEAERKRGGYYKHVEGESIADSILVELVKGHEGKAVYIDVWATWCGPCRSAMQQLEPYIDGLIEKGVDFVYVTDDSSDEKEYKKIAANSKGTHHKISEANMGMLKAKFGFSGIPAYILIDRKGFVHETPTWFMGPQWLENKLKEME